MNENETAGPRTPAPDVDTGQGDSVPRAASNDEAPASGRGAGDPRPSDGEPGTAAGGATASPPPDDYAAFLKSKEVRAQTFGFDVAEDAINPKLFPFQRKIVRWALRRGRAAVFAGTGLGKTAISLEWARHVVAFARAWDTEEGWGDDAPRVLVLAPLAVAPQTVREGAKFGITVTIVREQADVGGAGVYVTNYEMLDKFDPSQFVGVVLDESSILKNFMGKTKQALLAAFAETPYRLACTATPAPNDHLELGNHAQFLGVMASNEMIARWFVNDPMEAGSYRLKGHAADDFWRWVHSWAVSCERPSDLGFPDDGYVLPPLRMIERVVAADATTDVPDGHLFRTGSLSATSLHKEARLTTDARAAEVAAIVGAEPRERWLVLCNTDYEADALMAVIPGAVEVRGSMKREVKEERLDAFARGEIPTMISKCRIAGFGLNYQVCARVVFVGLSYSYEQLYQAIRRCWRFGQTRPVDAYIVRADTEGQVLAAVQEKAAKHEEMKKAMNDAMRREQLRSEDYGLVRTPPVLFAEGARWKLWHGDNVDVLRASAAGSVHLSVTSPPFSNLYIYSDAAEDMGNSDDDAQFMEHYRFTIRELHRVTVPGRIAAVHCKDLPLYKGRDGSAGLRDFPGAIIRAFEECGWTFHSRVTIWKCPVTEMQRTKNHGLLYKNLRSDSSVSRQGMADYLLAFRKWDGIPDAGTQSSEPVTHSHEDFPLEQWQAWASPVWMDVNQMRVLDYRDAKESSDERHICPLQLDVIERAIMLWSNKGDLVLDPFNGIGSTGAEALRLGRRYVGAELKESYCRMAAKVLDAAEKDATAPTLFSGVGGRV